MQTSLQVLYAGMSAKQPLTDHGNISSQIVCRDVLALIDHVSLLNESQPVRELPMSLLECTQGPCQGVGTHGLLQRHFLDDAVLSDFSGSHTERRMTVADAPSSTVAHTCFCDVHMLDIAACQWSSHTVPYFLRLVFHVEK